MLRFDWGVLTPQVFSSFFPGLRRVLCVSGVFVEDFIKIQTKGGPVATAAELSGRSS
jgi:hypothetical protein